MLPNVFDGHRTMVALGWLRAVEVPINTAFTGNMLRYALDLADVTVLVTVRDYLSRVEAIASELPKLTTIIVLDGPTGFQLPFRLIDRDELLTGATPATDLPGPHYWDLAALLFTSGTTGPSKAVRHAVGAHPPILVWVPEDTVGSGRGLVLCVAAVPQFGTSRLQLHAHAWGEVRHPRQVQCDQRVGRHARDQLRGSARSSGL